MNMRGRSSAMTLALAASMLGAGMMVEGIGNAYREVKQRDADAKDAERIEAAKAKRERKAAKRLAARSGSEADHG